MSAIEVVVRTPKPPEGIPGPSPLKGVLDLVVDGVNVTARLGEGPALLLLAELASGVALLSRGRRDRTAAPFYARGEAWEVGLEADGSDVLLTVYRTAPSVAVAVHERRIDLVTLRQALSNALDAAARNLSTQAELARFIESLREDHARHGGAWKPKDLAAFLAALETAAATADVADAEPRWRTLARALLAASK